MRTPSHQDRPLLQFLKTVIPLAGAFAFFYAALGWWLDSWRLLATAAVVSAYLGVVILARHHAVRGRSSTAALLAGYGLVGMAVVCAGVIPYIYPTLVLLCVMGAAQVLPYTAGRPLVTFLAVAGGASVFAAAVGIFAPADPGLPPFIARVVLAAGLVVVAALTFYLVWQFSARLRRTLAETEQSEQRFRSLVHATAQVVWRTTPAGDVIASVGWQQLTGQSEEEWRAGGWLQVVHPEDRERVAQAWSEATRSRQPLEIEYRVRLPDGQYAWMLARGIPLLDANGAVLEWIGSNSDVTERKRAEELQQLLADTGHLLATSLDYPTTLQKLADRVLPTLGDLCFFDVVMGGEALERVAWAHADPARRERFAEVRHHLPSAANTQHPVRLTHPSGEPTVELKANDAVYQRIAASPEHLAFLRWLGVHAFVTVPLIARGRRLGTLTFGLDSPDRRYSSSDVSHLVELARRVALAVDNARLYSEAQQAIRVRDEFLSIASHELKTPLTPLQLQLDALARHAPHIVKGSAAPGFQKRLRSLHRQSDRLNRLVNELLDLSRIMSGQMHLQLEPVDLGEVVREVAVHFDENGGGARPSTRLEVEAPLGLVGRWDRLRVEQIVANLVSNAVKYGEGQPVQVEVRQEGGFGFVRVTDRGIGIEPAAQERIFGRFERAVSVRHYGGLGVGLFIARQAVEALGGRIAVHSAPGQGATFIVQLPLSGPPEPREVEVPPPAPPPLQ